MNDLKIITVGGFAGGIGYFSTLPLEFIKQNIQTNIPMSQIRSLYKINGPKIFFRGATVGLKSIIPQMAIKFYSTKKYYQYTNNYLLSTALAGFTDGLFIGPPLAIQAIMQSDTNLSYTQAKNKVMNRKLFQYCMPMALRNSAYTFSLLGLSSLVKTKYYPDKKFNFVENFMLASTMNYIGVALCSPFDVIRAVQTNNIIKRTDTGLFNIMKYIYQTNGFAGFYRGYMSLLLNFGLRFPLTFSINFFILNLI